MGGGVVKIADYERTKKKIALPRGEVAYAEVGSGPVALSYTGSS